MPRNINTQVYDNVVNRSAEMRLYSTGQRRAVAGVVEDHGKKMVKIVANGDKTGKANRDALLVGQIKSTYSGLHAKSEKDLKELAGTQMSYQTGVLEHSSRKIFRVEQPPRMIAEEIVLKRPLYNDITLASGWNGIGVNERKRVESFLRKGMAEGKNAEELAKALQESSIFNISKNHSVAFVQTAITSVYAQADHEVYSANKALLRGYQYVAILDSHTTDTCAARDGHTYPVGDLAHLPPAHWFCRSTTTPILNSYADLLKSENIAQIRRRNLSSLSKDEIALYDGASPLKESYQTWLLRQPQEVQMSHLGDMKKVEMFQQGQLELSGFAEGDRTLSLSELRRKNTDALGVEGDTRRFVFAKQKLDALHLGAARPEELFDKGIRANLIEYYKLQAGELDGTLSYTNYRGTLIGNKKNMRARVLATPPNETQLRFNPITGRYEDTRLYQPNPAVLSNNLRLVNESKVLKDIDKEYINGVVQDLENYMSVNERAVVSDNLRITLTRYRENGQDWGNLKAVLNGQMKFDVMNTSDYIETQLRRDTDLLVKLSKDEFYDPVLGATSMQELGSKLVENIHDLKMMRIRQIPKIGRRLDPFVKDAIPTELRRRIDDNDYSNFLESFAKTLATSETPDRDAIAVKLGRKLHQLANYRGSRNEWYNLGKNILDKAQASGLYETETFGVQKRRMKARIGGRYFGPYYDTFSVNIRVLDKDVLEYKKLTRAVDVGMRVPVVDSKNRLHVREGFKNYFDYKERDTGIPIMSSDSVQFFPAKAIDEDLTNALNWASKSEFKVDKDFYDFTMKLMRFKDDKGKAKYYDELNEFRKHIAGRGDSYERFKAMEWLSKEDKAFSNMHFVDHRARIYDRGFIGPQSGETFRPFLNTAYTRAFSKEEFYNFQDQIGSFLGGASDKLEGGYSSLTVKGRQAIADKWRTELIKTGELMMDGRPNAIRKILESPFLQQIDGEEQGKVLRFAIEYAKINRHLGGDYSNKSLEKLKDYQIALALEQDASSSGAQIIALTTRNKQLAEMSNVVPTNQKRRLYDEIASATFDDPRFKELNMKLGLSEKDLRKAAKAQNMVTFYGAGERTGALNVETKLAKVLGKDESRLVVRATERDEVINQIDARIARFKDSDPDTYKELKALRQDVKDVFNKGLVPGDSLMEDLYFLDPNTKAYVEKMTRQYSSVVTPDDFKRIAEIMSEHLEQKVPILKDFTKYFGRLAEDYVTQTKPKDASMDWKTLAKMKIFGERDMGQKLHPEVARILGIDPSNSMSQAILKRFSWYKEGSLLDEAMFGVRAADTRNTSFSMKKKLLSYPGIQLKGYDGITARGWLSGKVKTRLGIVTTPETVNLYDVSVGVKSDLPPDWTKLPWVNFDGTVLEQKFTQVFEEKLMYKDSEGKWVTNILQVDQKTEPTWWEEFINKSDTQNEIVDIQKARTAFAVNGNHSNDATFVKNFHLWGRKNKVTTSTIHDAFYTNAGELLKAKKALREIYANSLDANSIKATLDEMRARGFPDDLYHKYLDEAIEIGLIPVAGRSRVGGKLLTKEDILTREDVLKDMPPDFTSDTSWYGIGG